MKKKMGITLIVCNCILLCLCITLCIYTFSLRSELSAIGTEESKKPAAQTPFGNLHTGGGVEDVETVMGTPHMIVEKQTTSYCYLAEDGSIHVVSFQYSGEDFLIYKMETISPGTSEDVVYELLGYPHKEVGSGEIGHLYLSQDGMAISIYYSSTANGNVVSHLAAGPYSD